MKKVKVIIMSLLLFTMTAFKQDMIGLAEIQQVEKDIVLSTAAYWDPGKGVEYVAELWVDGNVNENGDKVDDAGLLELYGRQIIHAAEGPLHHYQQIPLAMDSRWHGLGMLTAQVDRSHQWVRNDDGMGWGTTVVYTQYILRDVRLSNGQVFDELDGKTWIIGVRTDGPLGGWAVAGTAFGDVEWEETLKGRYNVHHSPTVNGAVPSPATAIGETNLGQIDFFPGLESDYVLEDQVNLLDIIHEPTFKGGFSGQELWHPDKPIGSLGAAFEYDITTDFGTTMHAGGIVTGIGRATWEQTVTDADGDSTVFERLVTVRTNEKPNITLVYDGGDFSGTLFDEGAENGGVEGWSNIPLKAIVSSGSGEENFIVDGFYFNRVIDDVEGFRNFGESPKGHAEQKYGTNTPVDGITVEGVMVDADYKTTELSARTDSVTVKIDMVSPEIEVSCADGTLNNSSFDDLSGIQHVRVGIVPTGGNPPDLGEYEEFDAWQSLVSKDGQYDIYVIATDKAGNIANAVLQNEFLIAKTTSLEISKVVVGKYGSYHRPFEVTVSLKDDEEAEVNGEYTVSSSLDDVSDYQLLFENGNGVVHIKHDEEITIWGLPVGVTYTVKETDAAVVGDDSFYIVTYNDESDATEATGKLEESGAKVAIKNERNFIPNMGIGENNTKLFMGSSLILLTFLMAALTYCDKKRSYK